MVEGQFELSLSTRVRRSWVARRFPKAVIHAEMEDSNSAIQVVARAGKRSAGPSLDLRIALGSASHHQVPF